MSADTLTTFRRLLEEYEDTLDMFYKASVMAEVLSSYQRVKAAREVLFNYVGSLKQT